LNGNYKKHPRSAQFASVFYAIGTNGSNIAPFDAAPELAALVADMQEELESCEPGSEEPGSASASYSGLTFAAAGPFCPCVTSKETFWPSFSDL